MVPKVAADSSFSCFWNSQLSTATKSDRQSSLATKLGSHFKFESSDIFSGSKKFRLKFACIFMYYQKNYLKIIKTCLVKYVYGRNFKDE